MTSEAQVLANRSNSTLSSGPKTPEGRAISSKNATKHGLYAKGFLADEKAEDYDALLGELIGQFSPVGIIERLLVEQLAQLEWSRRRCEKIEVGLFQDHRRFPMNAPFNTLQSDQAAALRDGKEIGYVPYGLLDHAAAFVQDCQGPNAFLKVIKVWGAHDRAFFRALHELFRLQSARRAGKAPEAPPALDLNVSVQGGSQPGNGRARVSRLGGLHQAFELLVPHQVGMGIDPGFPGVRIVARILSGHAFQPFSIDPPGDPYMGPQAKERIVRVAGPLSIPGSPPPSGERLMNKALSIRNFRTPGQRYSEGNTLIQPPRPPHLSCVARHSQTEQGR